MYFKMICIVDYKLGNLRSIFKAFEAINKKVIISQSETDITNASKLILPGVGSFYQGMQNLYNLNLFDLLKYEVLNKKKPILGICLGMQLFCKYGYEGGGCKGLSFVDAEVLQFNLKKEKLLHSGWDNISYAQESILFKDIKDCSDFYFVHSYYVKCNESIESSFCNYEFNFCASFEKDNIFATQFHPEKSQKLGLKLLENFANL
ncbi:imidazole glycerol phosphate synthase subunit HisH [Campylobacter insulaenigrae]|nr:imidazole glycerol phosphate synthase subunit HisH [Campylobacter insulaenigrae]MCR6570874.1 imidazole glycerol phosphate synthase subunit HisH [Campylobacter insulaenigrae]MCR6572468.1 imidazole glycerol phosphate synthase subunit HisH [Campylobacter insulaenigrae]MCR6574086.1 imidazole glycerol phosphate synthase subunit HisH [Campylobacter insulaenigrae]MCR6579278.1 imidazole glycerol phosphate synthase subunit HisH [Campylobacter insulaenigrae]MCR6580035.1 imidazole glycerol phosphate s